MTLLVPASHQRGSAELTRGVTAVLGPTNTGKTHIAIERMLQYPTGIIGLPLRLLAREVYNKIVEKVGANSVALITGEEKIKPRNPRFWVSTVEAMPRDLSVDFVCVDEIQLAADLDRGHVFTDRLLNRRGREETWLIGASTIEPLIRKLLPGVPINTRPRMSTLTFAGERKLSRLPQRSAIVAFSAEEVYAIAELLRRQRGGAAVVLGALSPRTRNAQVALYQSGEVDYIVATDAIGMGLNLDVDHIAFAGDRKFDGWQYRRLNPGEFGQIAGRAGRYIKDGTFGTTGRCSAFDEELVEALEQHRFDPLSMLQWRNSDLSFDSLEALQSSLDLLPQQQGLTRAPIGEDIMVLDIASRDEDVRRQAKTKADVQRLWEVCQLPDYRKVSPAAHAELALTLFRFVVRAGRVPDEWFQRHLSMFDRTDGDIDTLSARIAQVRTFNFIANRPDWLRDPEHWQGVTRQVEDSLSDALHERLAHRFVDRRTSVLMRRLRENAMLEAEITSTGDVIVEGEHIGHLHGFRFTPDPQAGGEAARTLNAAAQKALANEIEGRATRVNEAVDDAFVLANDGLIRWLGEPVGKLTSGDHILSPRVRVLADEQLTGAALEMVQRRLDLWVAQHVKKLLAGLAELEAGEGLEGIARGIAFQLGEALGVLERARVANETKSMDQNARAALRKLGVRFGAYHLYLPALLKPAPRALAAQLWALKHGGIEGVKGLDEVAHLASSGRTSFAADAEVPKGLYLAAGFRVCGERAVRVDILERLADLIRPAIAYRPGLTVGEPPAGTADGDGFVVTVAMTSLAGCSGEAFASILKSLGYQVESRKGPAITQPILKPAPTAPISAPTEGEEAATEASAEPAAEAAPAEEAPAPVAEEAPVASVEAVVEAPAVEGEATETTAEEALIEVWKPGRRTFENRRPQTQQRGRGPRRDQQGQPAQQGEGAPAGEGGGEQQRGPRRDKSRFEGFKGKGDRNQGDRQRHGHGKGRPDRGGQRSDRPFASSERPARERAPDPNSPFAKLLALKENLEKKKDS
jgi:ATP-dependent RNA helicase SUPV3L1/SUV3